MSVIAAEEKLSAPPSHAGRTNLVWVQANSHGMARRCPIPVELFLLVGRLRMLRKPISACGVSSLMKVGKKLWVFIYCAPVTLAADF
ncbi:hypothetical protein OIU76_026465 [Salix suchowensis]|uniref:Uncharacterized protein n=1 Tax=Salix suchowensis TaxID=1278906 RepID=A0ABQ9AF85_9ROSI|nr:hypothetical protein OIU77_009128 [Salix suchowensis]KAJ6377498.1 hypothetical protein OIU76_026465 [Salix suchowensis]